MKIFVTSSKQFYKKVGDIIPKLKKLGHQITPPNGYNQPDKEKAMQNLTPTEYQEWKAEMIRIDGKIVEANDAILVLNFKKKGLGNYIGGSTFLEMFKAFELGKKIFLYNPIPKNMLEDEIRGFGPTILNSDLTKIS